MLEPSYIIVRKVDDGAWYALIELVPCVDYHQTDCYATRQGAVDAAERVLASVSVLAE